MAIYGSLGEVDLNALSASISDTAVDIFVYDTRKDSDGGAWRKRTQHTSWYNETLNTATRGSRREFPAVAVIVGYDGGVTIYDADDPDLPMWMKFTHPNSGANYVGWGTYEVTSVSMLNGILSIGTNDGGINYGSLTLTHFLLDTGWAFINGNQVYKFDYLITERSNAATEWHLNYSRYTSSLISNLVNDVAMTVLPNAPIDETTGLPVPTIAVATNGGVSVIKDDGNVVDMYVSGESDQCLGINFTNSNHLAIRLYTGWVFFYVMPIADVTSTYWNGVSGYLGRWTDTQRDWGSGNTGIPINVGASGIVKFIEDKAAGHTNGLEILYTDLSSFANGMHVGVSTDFNTGWMHGDIKGAFLSDTDATNVTGSELVTNGTFNNTNASSVSSWDNVSVGSGTISEGSGYASLNRVDGGNTGRIGQGMNLVAGKSYFLSFDIVAGSTSGVQVRQYNSSTQGLSAVTRNFSGGTARTESFTFTCESGYDGFILIPIDNTNTTCRIDNFSVKRVEPDRSVNNNGLKVFGTITKSAVAAGAELVSYGFPGNNSDYLLQPYNSDLNFGTSDFCVMGWFKLASNNTQECIMMLANPTGEADYLLIEQQSNGDLRMQVDVYNGASVAYHTTQPTGAWIHYCGLKSGSRSQLYINGSRDRELHNGLDYDLVNNSFDNTSGSLYIGRRDDGSFPFSGQLALWKISASVPSPEQIKKIYEDEKVLFQENAACTLYGSSNAVTALTYDDSTNLLYAGTSSGRSDFQGLRRINNTTTAVTTAMSASNGLVAEQ